jgi:hypothetical protein
VAPINSSQLTITLQPSVIITLVYSDTNYDVITEFGCNICLQLGNVISEYDPVI